MTTATVLIATWNRADLLDDCLRSLARQRFTPGDEVVIADNGSTDHTATVVARHACQFPVPLTRIIVPTPGKSHAVAAALTMAHGDIVAFTDDDVQVDESWLTALKDACADPRVALAGGQVEPRWERTPPRWLQLAGHNRLGAPLGLLDYGQDPQPLGCRTLLGANLAVRRDVLHRLGGYATHLGKLRGTLLSGEDHELCARVQGAGYEARYMPTARVCHWVPVERMRVGYFLRWFFWSGITLAALESGQRHDHAVAGVPRYLARQFASGIGGACASAVRGQLPSAVDRSLDSAFAAGYAAARWGVVRTAIPGTPARTL